MTDQDFRNQLARGLFDLAVSCADSADVEALAPLWRECAELVREAGSAAAGAVAITAAAFRNRKVQNCTEVFQAFDEAARAIRPEPLVIPSVLPCAGGRSSGRFA